MSISARVISNGCIHSASCSSKGFSLCAVDLPQPKLHRLKPVLLNQVPDFDPWKRQGAGKGAKRRETERATLLDSAPSDSSDDSGQGLAWPPSRLAGTAFADFCGRSVRTSPSGPP